MTYLRDAPAAVLDGADSAPGLAPEVPTEDKKTICAACAAVGALEITGEASGKVRPETRDNRPGVPWKERAE